MQRYFIETETKINDVIQLNAEDAKHLSRVLRANIGDEIEVVDNQKNVFLGEIQQIDNPLEVKMLEDITKPVELPVDVQIACGISKGDKNEQIVKHATEMGASHFYFFQSENSVVKWQANKIEKKLVRLQQVAKSAAKQSHRQVIPTVEFISEKDLINLEVDQKVVCYEESAKQGEKSNFKKVIENLNADTKLLAVFGPEGGFTPKEIEDFEQSHFEVVGLGPRILRAETAPLYVLGAISYALELN